MSFAADHATHFLLKYIAEIVIGLVVVLLAALKLLGQRTQADAVKASLCEPPVTQVEMLEHQLETANLIRDEFGKVRTEIRSELGVIHRRIDELHINHS